MSPNRGGGWVGVVVVLPPVSGDLLSYARKFYLSVSRRKVVFTVEILLS